MERGGEEEDRRNGSFKLSPGRGRGESGCCDWELTLCSALLGCREKLGLLSPASFRFEVAFVKLTLFQYRYTIHLITFFYDL